MYLVDKKRMVIKPGSRNNRGQFVPTGNGLGRSERLAVVVDPEFVQASRNRVHASFYKAKAFREAARKEAVAINEFQRDKRFAKLKEQANADQS